MFKLNYPYLRKLEYMYPIIGNVSDNIYFTITIGINDSMVGNMYNLMMNIKNLLRQKIDQNPPNLVDYIKRLQ